MEVNINYFRFINGWNSNFEILYFKILNWFVLMVVYKIKCWYKLENRVIIGFRNRFFVIIKLMYLEWKLVRWM